MRAIRLLAAGAAMAALVVLSSTSGALAQTFRVSTPYPAVAVEPGDTVSFDVQVTGSGQRVALSVADAPRGWTTILRGGGFVIDGVLASPNDPPEVTLEVGVPPHARPGGYRVVLAAAAGGTTRRLPLDLRVAREAAGSATLTTDSAQRRGFADANFTFDLELRNETPRETAFTLEAVGLPGWRVDAHPVGEPQAVTTNVEAGGTAAIEVEVDPPDETPAGTYPILVQATGGDQQARIELEVEIIGNFALTLTTPSERLNADAVAGRASRVELEVVNDGTAPIVGLELSATPPVDWEVEFEPAAIDALEPGQTRRVLAVITPSGDAVAGDYIVTVQASSDDVTQSVDLRTTVKTSSLWGGVGIALIAMALVGLGLLFRRYGRR